MPQQSTEAQSTTTRFGSAPLVPVTLAFLLGVLLETYARLPPGSLIVGGAVSAGAALWWWKRTRSGVIALLLLWSCLGALRMAVWERHPDTRLTTALSDEPQPVQLHGIVVDDPVELFEPGEAESESRNQQSAISNQQSATRNPRQVCVLSLRHVRTEDGWQPIRGRVRATVGGQTPQGRQLDRMGPDPTGLRYGDEILVEGLWTSVPSPGNPGQYDWQAALARKRIHGLLRVRLFDGLVILERGKGNPVLAAIFRLRDRWEKLIREHFGAREANLLLGLLLGRRVALDEDLKDAFIETGTMHLLVISGFHVGVIALLLELCLRLIGLSWRWRLIGSAIALGGYGFLTGLAPPILRATLMAWMVLGALALDRVISWPNVVAAAALAILALNPSQAFDAGFQLSFGAVISLLAFTRQSVAWLEPRLGWLRPLWWRRYLTLSLSATSAIWIGLSPLLAWYFHLVSPVSLLANLLIAPLMSALIFVGTSALALGTLIESSFQWSRVLLTGLLGVTLQSVSICHAMPGGYWFVERPSAAFLAGYYGLLGASIAGIRRRWRRRWLVFAWALGFAVWVSGSAFSRLIESRWLFVDILDVGHGDSIVIRTPRGQILLVDAGSVEAGRFRLIPYLRSLGLVSVDALILTHTDADHLGGAIALLQEMRVRRIFTNGAPYRSASAELVHRLARERSIPETIGQARMRIEVDPRIRVEILHPPPGLVPGAHPESNDNSIVLKVAMGSVSFLLTGDIEEAGLPVLLQASPEALQATVLKVPHHGSRLGAAGERLLEAAHPTLAVLSVGRLHRLPSSETLEALERHGAAVFSTRAVGAISFRTDGKRLQMRTFRGSRAWQAVRLSD